MYVCTRAWLAARAGGRPHGAARVRHPRGAPTRPVMALSLAWSGRGGGFAPAPSLVCTSDLAPASLAAGDGWGESRCRQAPAGAWQAIQTGNCRRGLLAFHPPATLGRGARRGTPDLAGPQAAEGSGRQHIKRRGGRRRRAQGGVAPAVGRGPWAGESGRGVTTPPSHRGRIGWKKTACPAAELVTAGVGPAPGVGRGPTRATCGRVPYARCVGGGRWG